MKTPRATQTFAALAALSTLASAAMAQLTPDRLFYGVGRKAPMTVEAPEGADVEIRLMDPASGEAVATAAAAAGGVDLAALFPMLWDQQPEDVLYAQAFADGAALGPAVVIDPMVSVDRARLLDPNTLTPTTNPRAGKPMFDSDVATMQGRPTPPSTYSGFRAYVDKDVVLETTAGDIRIRLRPDKAPNHAWNFRTLVDGGYYTGIEFHRIVPSFVIQVGDPTGKGSGGPGYQIDLEKSDLPHDFGVLSMARTADPDTGGSQIFICLTRQATAQLDGSYTTFGQTIAGADTVRALGNTPVRGQTPIEAPEIEQAYLVDAAPFGTGPAPVTRADAAATETPEDAER